jgi:hypothetical protein
MMLVSKKRTVGVHVHTQKQTQSQVFAVEGQIAVSILSACVGPMGLFDESQIVMDAGILYLYKPGMVQLATVVQP